MADHHPSLRRSAANLIGGAWRPIAGDAIVSTNPAEPDSVLWTGAANLAHVVEAVEAARTAQPQWAAWGLERRAAVLRRYQDLCRQRAESIAELICDETGKAMWDARQEAGALAAKIDITLESTPNNAMARVTGFDLDLGPTRKGRCWFRPHGVMAVLAPFNFPAHLPNGHIAPALAMGNTVVLKPSDKTPAVGQLLAELLQEVLDAEEAPAGVVNLVQGGADVARALVSAPDIDGILFTGSWPVGRSILEANLDHPGRIVALEMGGNNAVIVMPDADLRQAAIEIARSAYVTTGQRCTCTRRLIVHRAIAEKLVSAIQKIASTLIIGHPRAEHPVFAGPIISASARDAVLAFQSSAVRGGARALLESTAMDRSGGGWYITPGLLQVDRFTSAEQGDAGCDVEVFGPLLRFALASDLDDALAQANATRFGLAASIFTRDGGAAERFLAEARAGCLNINVGTAGASSKLPFGGLGLSGNHRPAGSFSLDYCAYPVAGMAESGDATPIPEGMTVADGWI
ncbi:MAG: aldehyde dehydrogenase family protein [Phycisphaerales bacterium JB039]